MQQLQGKYLVFDNGILIISYYISVTAVNRHQRKMELFISHLVKLRNWVVVTRVKIHSFAHYLLVVEVLYTPRPRLYLQEGGVAAGMSP